MRNQVPLPLEHRLPKYLKPKCLFIWVVRARGQGNNPEPRIPTTWKPITNVRTPSSMEMTVGHQTITYQGKMLG
ncbi:hypothetical protein ACFX14_007602 [Malus domestica]